MTTPPRDVSQLLADLRAGDRQALERLMPIVYRELRELAARYLRRERHAHTLQPTALVHEVYMRLAGQVHERGANWADRAQFFGVAARVMRQVLVDYARATDAAKRGGGRMRVTLHEGSHVTPAPDLDILALEAALTRLAAMDADQARLVELRFFAGLTVEEAADVLGRSPRTIKRDWRSARAWLQRELSGVAPTGAEAPGRMPADAERADDAPAGAHAISADARNADARTADAREADTSEAANNIDKADAETTDTDPEPRS